MNVGTRTAIAATALAVALALTGCTTTGGVPTPAPTAATSVPATVAPDVLAGVEFGAVLTQEQADSVEARQDGSHAYRLADGTYILTSYKVPLPDAVKADVAAKIDSEKITYADGIVGGVTESVKKYKLATGRSIVYIVTTVGRCPSDGLFVAAWVVYDVGAGFPCLRSEADAVAAGTAYIATKTTPADWDLLVSAG